MTSDNRQSVDRKILLAIIVVGFLLRVMLIFFFNSHLFATTWAFGFETGRVAASIADGQGFSSPFQLPTGPTAWLTPAYPYGMAAVFRMFGIYSTSSALVILLFNCAVSALTSLFVYSLAKRVLGRETGLLAASLWMVYPPSVWHAINTVWDTSLYALLCLLIVHGAYVVRDRSELKGFCVYGLFTGLVALVNPTSLSYVLFLWVFFLFLSPFTAQDRFKRLAVFTLPIILVPAPWMLRNFNQFGHFFLKSNLGLELKIGNNAEAWENFLEPRVGGPMLLSHPTIVPKEMKRFRELGEVRYVETAFEEAMTFISRNPDKFVRLSLRRIRDFWLGDLEIQNEWTGNLKINASVSWLKTLCHLLPLPFALVGLILAIRHRLDLMPMIFFLTLFPIIYYITHVSERYRFPIEPFIVIFVSFGLLSLIRTPAVARPLRAVSSSLRASLRD